MDLSAASQSAEDHFQFFTDDSLWIRTWRKDDVRHTDDGPAAAFEIDDGINTGLMNPGASYLMTNRKTFAFLSDIRDRFEVVFSMAVGADSLRREVDRAAVLAFRAVHAVDAVLLSGDF